MFAIPQLSPTYTSNGSIPAENRQPYPLLPEVNHLKPLLAHYRNVCWGTGPKSYRQLCNEGWWIYRPNGNCTVLYFLTIKWIWPKKVFFVVFCLFFCFCFFTQKLLGYIHSLASRLLIILRSLNTNRSSSTTFTH